MITNEMYIGFLNNYNDLIIFGFMKDNYARIYFATMRKNDKWLDLRETRNFDINNFITLREFYEKQT